MILKILKAPLLLQDYGAFSLYDPMVKTGKQRFAIGREFFYYGLKVNMSMKNHKYSLTERSRLFLTPTNKRL
jgi:hypothetical protein